MKKRLFLLPELLFLISVGLHLGVAFSFYYPGSLVVGPLTAGMFLAWLFSSRLIAAIIRATPDDASPFAYLGSLIDPLYKYPLIFILLYALSNFFMSLSPAPAGSGLFDLNITPQKLRGLSGFWIFFYALAVVMRRAGRKFGK